MKNKTIKRNYFSKAQYILFIIYFTFIILLSFVLGFVFAEIDLGFPMLLSYFFIVFSITIFFILLTNPLTKALMNMNRTADYSKFSKRIEKILKNNLEEESKNYVLMIKSNYMFAVDKEEGIKLFEEVKKPTYSRYIKDYYNIKACYHINMRQFDEAFDCLGELRKLKVNEKIINMTKTVIRVFGTDNKIDDIEKIFPTKTKLKFTDLCNANTLLYYYSSRGLNTEAKEYAKFILDNTNCLNEFIKLASVVLEKEN